jgi:hypothetical protein
MLKVPGTGKLNRYLVLFGVQKDRPRGLTVIELKGKRMRKSLEFFVALVPFTQSINTTSEFNAFKSLAHFLSSPKVSHM